MFFFQSVELFLVLQGANFLFFRVDDFGKCNLDPRSSAIEIALHK